MPSNKNHKNKQKSPAEVAAEHRAYVGKTLPNYRHSRRPLFKSIIEALDACGTIPTNNDGNSYLDLAYSAVKLMDDLGESSRQWAVSLHHMYTVCNPKIEDQTNVAYSPVYQRYACELPTDVSGELDYMDTSKDKLVRHGDKLVGDSRFRDASSAVFGHSWDHDGYVTKHNDHGTPQRDGWFGWLCSLIDDMQAKAMASHHRGRRFSAFLIAHTRDERDVKRDAIVTTKPWHAHGVIRFSNRISRYQMMERMGVNFEDYTDTFNWIAKTADQKSARTATFIDSLNGLIKNYEVPNDYTAKLQYLVHESFGAIKDDKVPYSTNEVISWLPDNPGETYSAIAGVYDNQAAATGINADVLRNLHSPYNTAHHIGDLVGVKTDNKPFTYAMVRDVRSLVTHARASNKLSRRTLEALPDAIMSLIRTGAITVNDWPSLVHAALDDADADKLLGDKRMTERLNALINGEIEATIHDPNYSRNMTTIMITASVGGIGKTYLGNLLAQYYDHGRTSYGASTHDSDKTVDLWQDYHNELSAVIDELEPNSVAWQTLKDTLDPQKVPHVPSRYTNKTPWGLHHMFITNVFGDGVAEYVRRVLRYAPGVAHLGYLKEEESEHGKKSEWHLIENDTGAARSYLAQLSQLLRRLPVWIELTPTGDGKGTNIKVSVLAYQPSGRKLNRYDYARTDDSTFRIDTILTDKTPAKVAKRIAKETATVIAELQSKANKVFAQDPMAWLPDCDGWIADNCDFSVKINRVSGEPLLTNEPIHNTSTSISTPVMTACTSLVDCFNGDYDDRQFLADGLLRFARLHRKNKLFWSSDKTLTALRDALHDAKTDAETPGIAEKFLDSPAIIYKYVDTWLFRLGPRATDAERLTLIAIKNGLKIPKPERVVETVAHVNPVLQTESDQKEITNLFDDQVNK
ncbi:hypothetical protein ACFP1L_09220 [Lactiplantibacillus nangangensis]|uniref:Uncharacterized protein n=1 Tax=Lactiplantibacillus nangangensis TaxID=2559917 RepID=A0ABW1SK69_9LACO|nr:hypothetical protein [Lactiplantibacillus nangangensis]